MAFPFLVANAALAQQPETARKPDAAQKSVAAQQPPAAQPSPASIDIRLSFADANELVSYLQNGGPHLEGISLAQRVSAGVLPAKQPTSANDK